MHRRLILFHPLALVVLLGLGGFLSRPAQAQLDALSGKFQGGGGDAAKVTVKAAIEPAAANRPARLVIVAQVAPGWHIYSITQSPGGPIRSKIKLPPSSDYRLLGDFSVDPPAAVHQYNDIWPDLKVEEHSGKVTWQAPIELAAGVDPTKLEIAGAVNAQACADTCIPPKDYKFVARLATGGSQAGNPPGSPPLGNPQVGNPTPPMRTAAIETPGRPAAAGDGERPGIDILRAGHATLRGRIEPGTVAPGGQARLILSADPEAPWYVYALAEFDPDEPGSPKPTLIEMEPTHGLSFGRPVASVEPSSKSLDGMPIRYHAKVVQWSIPIRVAADAAPGDYAVNGLIGLMTCKDGSCDLPAGARFSGTLHLGAASPPAPLFLRPAKYDEAKRLAAVRMAANPAAVPAGQAGGELPGGEVEHRPYEIVELNGETATTLPMVLLYGFLGGLILNVMPCVLPVIGLKILSFVEQGGQSHARLLLLNVVYSAGMMVVFLVLATLAVTLNFGWGEHFNSLPFAITLTALVFAMALSFLGVWEIPIPGFVGSGATAQAAARGGLSGAFAKGVITTVLATPCIGPYLGAVFGFTVNQTPEIIYLVFATIGLGMASPYLLIGAFPRLIAFLPKPGAWMETFKQLMGFLLLGTVVYLMQTVKQDYFIATFALLVGIWAACWWVGRMPFTLSPRRRLLGWLEGAAVATVVGSIAFTWLVPHPNVLPWKPFSRRRWPS